MSPPFDVSRYQDPLGIQRVLHNAKTIAIVGLSKNELRASYFVGYYLKRHGYRVIPVNPAYPQILGETCYPSLLEVPERVDVVDVFRKPEDVPPIVDDAIRIGAKVLWLQIGVIHEAAEQRAREAGLEVVANRCMKIEHARLFGGLGFFGVYTGVISSKRPRWLPF